MAPSPLCGGGSGRGATRTDLASLTLVAATVTRVAASVTLVAVTVTPVTVTATVVTVPVTLVAVPVTAVAEPVTPVTVTVTLVAASVTAVTASVTPVAVPVTAVAVSMTLVTVTASAVTVTVTTPAGQSGRVLPKILSCTCWRVQPKCWATGGIAAFRRFLDDEDQLLHQGRAHPRISSISSRPPTGGVERAAGSGPLKYHWTVALPLKKLEAEAMELSRRERAELAHRLIVSLEEEPSDDPAEVEQAWTEEIQRRVAQLEAGTVELIPAEQVFAELRNRLRS